MTMLTPVLPTPTVSFQSSAEFIPAGLSNPWLKKTGSTLGLAMVGVAVLVALWYIGCSQVADLPTPTDTLRELQALVAHGFHDGGAGDQGILLQLMASLTRVFSGFGLAVLLGVPLGLAMGSSARTWKAANPIVQFLRPVSPLAWYPLLLIVFTNAGKASVWVICLTGLWPIVLNTAAGASSVPSDQRNVAKVFHLKRAAYVRHIVMPHTLPSIVTGLRLSMGTAWMVIVAVEMMSGKTGIGNYVWTVYNAGNMAKVTASVILIGATGLILDLIFLKLSRIVTPTEARP